VTSHRKRKRAARTAGLTDAELQLTRLLGEVLDLLRWNQVLGFGNQYLLHEKLRVTPAERERVMHAAAAAVEQDGRLQDWRRRLQEVEVALQRVHGQLATRGAGEAAAEAEAGDRG
jgi:hypothetical protein